MESLESPKQKLQTARFERVADVRSAMTEFLTKQHPEIDFIAEKLFWIALFKSDGEIELDELPESFPPAVREAYRRAGEIRREMEQKGWKQRDFADELRRMLVGDVPPQ